MPRRLRKDRIEALLDMVGLKAVAGRAVGTFSKGMARRIGLAQALINDPDLLILDEPTTGLDPIGTRQIKDLIIKLAQRGKTVLLCSHLLADVEDVCDRIAILYGGKVRAEGDVASLLRQADKRQITTGPLSDNTLDQIRRVIEAEQADCEVSSPMERLEAFFVRTVYEAQQQAQPTHGAVSTTHIGDFLSGDAQKEVLDQLVSAKVSKDMPRESIQTEKVASERPALEPDKQLLDQLTQEKKTIDTQQVASQGSETGPQETPAQQPPEKNILDQLVDPKKSGDSQTEIPKEDDTHHA
jgi:ABC-2 type transport system ATP-binding protein